MPLPADTHTIQLTGDRFSTYRLGGPLMQAAQPNTVEEAIAALEYAQRKGEAITILGWGSNSIIAKQGIPGLTLITRNLTETRINPDSGDVFFAAGVFLGKAATQLQKSRLGGAAFWVGIPGTIGGAVRMNAGAMGSETAKHLVSAQVYNTKTQNLETWEPERLQFSYRHSAIDPVQYIVLGASFQFIPLSTPDAVEELTRQMEENISFRRQHHPTEPNGGSVFQNPHPDHPVGRLLDQLGARDPDTGWQEGGMRISPRHANFIINTGQGTSTDVLRLMARIKQEIKTHYGFNVHPENIFLGQATPEEQELLAYLAE